MNIMNCNEEIVSLQAPKGSVSRRCPDIKKLTKLIGYNWDSVSLEDGLANLVEWYNLGRNDEEFFR